MRIGELAKQAGLATSAVRFYERAGLLPRPGRSSGRRVYEAEALDRLALIGFARACGFTLGEIRQLLAAEGAGRARTRWTPFARAKLAEVAALEARARTMRRLLQRTLDCHCLDLAECGRVVRAAGRPTASPSARRGR